MIDWNLTKQKFGNVDLSQKRPKIVAKCDNCNATRDLTIRVKSRIRNNNIDWLCYKCACNKPDIKKKHSTIQKKIWEKKDYVDKRKKSSQELWKDEKYRSKHSESVRDVESRRKCSEAAKKAWMDENYRKAHAVSLVKQLTSTPNTEKRMQEILDSLNIEYKHQVVLGPYTFDFLIHRDETDLLLEVNSHWVHRRPDVARKDEAKSSYVSTLDGYELKTVWEHQLFDFNKMQALLKRWVGFYKESEKIDLKDLSIKIANEDEMQYLMCNYHYMGSLGRRGFYVGGYIGDKLVCGAVFSHPIRREVYVSYCRKDEAMELSRFVIVPFVRNKNLASYFLSRCVKLVPSNIRYLFSFSDPSAGHAGTIYRASNWVFDGYTAPSYFYVNEDGWKLHKKTLYNQARSAHMVESEFVSTYGYRKYKTPPLSKFHLKLK